MIISLTLEAVIKMSKKKEAAGTWQDIKDLLLNWPSWLLWPHIEDIKEAEPDEWSQLHREQKAGILAEVEQKKGYQDQDVLSEADFFDTIEHLRKRLIELNPGDPLLQEAIYDHLPQGPGTNALKQVLSCIAAGRKLSKRGVTYKERDRFPKDKLVEYESSNSSFLFTFSGESYEKIAKTSSRQGANTRKILNFLLTKANSQNFDHVIEFDLQELVDRGIYSNKDSAYKGIKICVDQLKTFELEGTQKRGSKETRNAKAYVFTGRDISYTACKVITMPGVIEALCPYFNLFPKWTYKLSKAAFSMIDHIYYMARQRRSQDSIKNKGYFTVSFKTLCEELALPAPAETTRHTQFIINPLLDAVDEIEAASQTDIKITPYYDHDYKDINIFLKGYLKVEVEKPVQDYAIERAKSRQKKLKAADKKEAGK